MPNPVIKSIILDNYCVIEEPEGRDQNAKDFILKLLTSSDE